MAAEKTHNGKPEKRRIEITPEKKAEVMEMLQNGIKHKQIKEETGISLRSIEKISQELKKSTGSSGKVDQENVPAHPIDKLLQRRSEQKIVEYSSDVILRDFKLEMEAARVLHQMELKYRQTIENIGLDWNDFLEIAIDRGYELILKAHERISTRVTFQNLESAMLLKTTEKRLAKEGL